MALRKRYAFALIVVIGQHIPDGVWARDPLPSWRMETPAGRLEAVIRPAGRSESLVVTLSPKAGVRIEPRVLRIDPPALTRNRIAGRFPATIRVKGTDGPLEAVLPLTGPLRFADQDSNDGMLRVEFRYCGGDAGRCSVGRADVPLRATGGSGGG